MPLKGMTERIPAPADSPAFVVAKKSKSVSLTDSSFVYHLKRLAGFSADEYSGHSFRRGVQHLPSKQVFRPN